MSLRALTIGLLMGLAMAVSRYDQLSAASFQRESYSGQFLSTKVITLGCNDSVFSQVPGHLDLFLSRQAKGCSPASGWQVVLDHFDWTSKAFTLQKVVIPTPLQITGATITTAYDPYPASYAGDIWIAFECAGPSIFGASTCLAPMNPSTYSIDPSRTYVVITGNRNAPGIQSSASDPKLFSFEGKIYLYWTTVVMNNGKWVGIAERGAELSQEEGGLRLLWVNGSGGRAIEAHDPKLSVEVWADGDMFSIIQVGSRIYATAGRAGGACVSPSVDMPRCYQLMISETTVPLGFDIFNRKVAPDELLPTASQEYARFLQAPNGRLFIIGHFVPHGSAWFKQRPLAPGSGVIAFPIDVGALFPH